jgi:hypothetical protein
MQWGHQLVGLGGVEVSSGFVSGVETQVSLFLRILGNYSNFTSFNDNLRLSKWSDYHAAHVSFVDIESHGVMSPFTNTGNGYH